MKPILEFALDLATEAHKGQKRRDGKDYITHPIAVSEIIKRDLDILGVEAIDIKGFGTISIILALLHDSVEDNKNFTEELIVDEFIKWGYIAKYSPHATVLYNNLRALNKDHSDSYKQYICNLLKVDLYHARVVKIADLEHNLSDLMPGSLRDKYELAQYILTNN